MLWAFLQHVDRDRVEPVIVFLEAGPFEREVAALGMATLVRDAGRLRDTGRFAATVARLAGDMRRERPSIVLGWMAKTHLYAAPAAVLAGIPDRLVWWQHGMPTGYWLERLATVLPARAVGASSYAAARGQETLRPRRRTFVVHPGIDIPGTPPEANVADVRQALALPAGRAVLGCVGRLEPGRRQHDVLRAVATLRRRGRAVHAVIVGGDVLGLSGDYEPYLRRLARELDLDSAVTFTGHVPDASPYLQALDVLVQPGPESFGIALLEAMAIGVPVIAADTGGAGEIVEAGCSGLLVPAGDQPRLVEAIERLLGDRALRDRLAAAGRERVRGTFGAERMAIELQRQLEAIAAESAPRRRAQRSMARR